MAFANASGQAINHVYEFSTYQILVINSNKRAGSYLPLDPILFNTSHYLVYITHNETFPPHTFNGNPFWWAP